MRKCYGLGWMMLLVLLVPAPALAQTFFTGTFSSAQETGEDASDSDATGTAALVLTDEGLRFYITVEGLSGPITGAHFHEGTAGTSGGVVRNITEAFDGTTATGLWAPGGDQALTPERIAQLFAGELYLNVHTDENPAGEIRAQVYPSAGTSLWAALDTAQEIPTPVISEATGTAALLATDAGVAFYVTVENLTGNITAAHFHEGAIGTTGPPVRTITGDFEGETAFGFWTADDAEPLDADALAALLAGNLYLNVHTAFNGPGEIRGQVLPNGGAALFATLDASQETGEVDSDAFGTGALRLTSQGLVYHITVEGLSGDIDAAHFHQGGFDENGPPVRTITGDFEGNSAWGVWTSTDDEPLTTDLIADLIDEGIYLNIHTAENPSGEIRGQVQLAGGTSFCATLTNEQELHDVDQEASGTAVVQLFDGDVFFQISVDGLSGDIAAAHFHEGGLGETGPPVRTITADFVGNSAAGIWSPGDETEPLTADLVAKLLAGDLYLNVHTAENAAGEIRGQVLLCGGTGMRAALDTAQEIPAPEGSEATGTAAFTLTDDGLVFRVTVEGLTGDIAAAHFHQGAIGTTGGPVRTITGDFDGGTAEGVWTADDAEPLDADALAALLAGDLYLNVHTAANGPGEIRGQVLLNDGLGAAVRLSPGQEVPDTPDSDGRGTASLSLVEAGILFRLTVDGLTGPVTGAHFHQAPFGENGGVVRNITDAFGEGQTATGLWSPDDDEALTTEYAADYVAGNLYLNIHTAANPPGEIRGQIEGGPLFGTAVEPTGEVPAAFALRQNYPNPFNPATTLEFDLASATHTRLDVFDVLGRRVATLLDGPLAAGTYRATFDASALPSGVYLYRLTASGQTRTRTMLLVK